MSSGDIAAVVITICVVIAMAALVAVLTQAFALIRELRRQLAEFEGKAGPALTTLADTAELAQTELGRLRDLLNVVQRIAGLAESAGAATVRAAALPLDKVRSALSVLRGAHTDDAHTDDTADTEPETPQGRAVDTQRHDGPSHAGEGR